MTIVLLTIFAALFPTAHPCEYEDGSEMLDEASYSVCSWDAGSSGNGVGDSFVVVKTTEDGATYLTYFYEDGHVES